MEYKLFNEENEVISSYDVEYDEDVLLISYETKEKFRNQGFASLGLNLLKEELFEKEFLILQLINLSGDYSRKVAENAGFFAQSLGLDSYLCLNPLAENIILKKIGDVKIDSSEQQKVAKSYKKIASLRTKETNEKQKMMKKLMQLQKILADVDNDEYRKETEIEIKHLENIFSSKQDTIKLR